MKYDKAIEIAVLVITLVVFATAGSAQDLGSANRLFGGGEKKTTKPKVVKQPVAKNTKKASPAKSKPSPKPAAKAAPKNTPKVAPTAKKPTPKAPVKAVPAETNEAGTRFRSFETSLPGSNTTPAKTTAATESRYEDLIEEGNAARDDRDYRKAESAYAAAKSIKPRDARAIYGLGNLYSDQQRWEDAEKAYRAALKLEPANAIAHIALSYVLAQPIATPDLAERYSEAERLGRRAVQLDSRNALAYDQLGVALELRGLIGAETENAYRRAIQLDGTFAPAHAHLGRLLRRRGLFNEAAAAYKKADALATDVATLILVAEVMQSEQRFADSEPLLRTAIGGDPRNPSALILLGRALTAQSKFADAEQTLRKAELVSPNAFMPNSLLGSLYWRQGKLEQAESALMQAARYVSPLEKRQLAVQFGQIADGYKKAGQAVNAERAYRRAKALENEAAQVVKEEAE